MPCNSQRPQGGSASATLVVSTALATRDFQDVHHDPVLSVQKGTKDIFLNILTTTGLVQRYVTELALTKYGPAARVAACELRLGAPAYPCGGNSVAALMAARGVPSSIQDVNRAVEDRR